MATTLSRKVQIISRLQNAGNVSSLNDAASEQRREAINKQVREVRRDYQRKERESMISASQLILTA